MKLRYKLKKEDIIAEMRFRGRWKIGFKKIFEKESILKLCEALEFRPTVIALYGYEAKEQEISILPVEYHHYCEEPGYSIVEFREENLEKILDVFAKNIKKKGIELIKPIKDRHRKICPLNDRPQYFVRNTAEATLMMYTNPPFGKNIVLYFYNMERISYNPEPVIQIETE